MFHVQLLMRWLEYVALLFAAGFVGYFALGLFVLGVKVAAWVRYRVMGD